MMQASVAIVSRIVRLTIFLILSADKNAIGSIAFTRTVIAESIIAVKAVRKIYGKMMIVIWNVIMIDAILIMVAAKIS